MNTHYTVSTELRSSVNSEAEILIECEFPGVFPPRFTAARENAGKISYLAALARCIPSCIILRRSSV